MVLSGSPYSKAMVRRTRSINRANCKMDLEETLLRSLKVKDLISGKVSKLVSASDANVGKMLRLQASQQVPPSQRRPSESGKCRMAKSSKM
mmetsp:Transcript_122241/g.353442  ORF Transcript_122241/g.353442 Transcript_122241/m.353442 type:complete len:91 (-) Transcript_122241:817-1089(-)